MVEICPFVYADEALLGASASVSSNALVGERGEFHGEEFLARFPLAELAECLVLVGDLCCCFAAANTSSFSARNAASIMSILATALEAPSPSCNTLLCYDSKVRLALVFALPCFLCVYFERGYFCPPS